MLMGMTGHQIPLDGTAVAVSKGCCRGWTTARGACR
jgi:hypothetical protein